MKAKENLFEGVSFVETANDVKTVNVAFGDSANSFPKQEFAVFPLLGEQTASFSDRPFNVIAVGFMNNGQFEVKMVGKGGFSRTVKKDNKDSAEDIQALVTPENVKLRGLSQTDICEALKGKTIKIAGEQKGYAPVFVKDETDESGNRRIPTYPENNTIKTITQRKVNTNQSLYNSLKSEFVKWTTENDLKDSVIAADANFYA